MTATHWFLEYFIFSFHLLSALHTPRTQHQDTPRTHARKDVLSTSYGALPSTCVTLTTTIVKLSSCLQRKIKMWFFYIRWWREKRRKVTEVTSNLNQLIKIVLWLVNNAVIIVVIEPVNTGSSSHHEIVGTLYLNTAYNKRWHNYKMLCSKIILDFLQTKNKNILRK